MVKISSQSHPMTINVDQNILHEHVIEYFNYDILSREEKDCMLIV